MTTATSALLAVAEADFHKKTLKFIDLGAANDWTKKPLVRVWHSGQGGRPCHKAFEDASPDYYEAWFWIHEMQDSEYTAGFGWQIIPYTQEALDDLAKAWEVSAEKIAG